MNVQIRKESANKPDLLEMLKFTTRNMLNLLYANGIGPVTKDKNRKRVADILTKADCITLRGWTGKVMTADDSER